MNINDLDGYRAPDGGMFAVSFYGGDSGFTTADDVFEHQLHEYYQEYEEENPVFDGRLFMSFHDYRESLDVFEDAYLVSGEYPHVVIFHVHGGGGTGDTLIAVPSELAHLDDEEHIEQILNMALRFYR